MPNYRLQSTTTHQVWDESSQTYINVPDTAWVAGDHIIFPPWFQIWLYQSPNQVWDQSSQSWVYALEWQPWNPGTMAPPAGYSLVLPQPSGNTNKKNTPDEVVQAANLFISRVTRRMDPYVQAHASMSYGIDTATNNAATMAEINTVMSDSNLALVDAIASTMQLNSLAINSFNIQVGLAQGAVMTISAQGNVLSSDAAAIHAAIGQMIDNTVTMQSLVANIQSCLSVAQGIASALAAEGTAPPDIVAQAQKNVADIAGLLSLAQSNMAAGLFGYGGGLGAGLGLNNNGAPGIFSGGDDPDDGGAQADAAAANASASLDAP